MSSEANMRSAVETFIKATLSLPDIYDPNISAQVWTAFCTWLDGTSSNNLNARVAFQFKAANILKTSFIVIVLHFSVYFRFL